MSKIIPSPLLPVAPTRVRALGDSPCHPLQSLSEDLAIYPVAIETDAVPALLAARGSERLSFTDGLVPGTVDVQVPLASQEGANSFFARPEALTLAVDTSLAGEGTISVEVGGPASIQGYFALQNIHDKAEPRIIIASPIPESDDMWDARDAASRGRYPATSPIQELVLAALRWKMTGPGVVDPASVFGGLAFAITNTVVGEYDVTFSFQIPPGAVLIATAEGAFLDAQKGPGDNVVRITALVGGLPDDVPPASEIRLLILAPRTSRGIKNQLTDNRERYTNDLSATDGTYPPYSTFRDAVFLPFNFRTDPTGLINPDDPLTVVPPNVEIYQDNTAGVIAIGIGRTSPELCVSSFYLAAGAELPIDYSQLATKGRLLVTTGVLATTYRLSGYVLQGVTRER